MTKYVKIGNFVRIRTGKVDVNNEVEGGEFPFFTCSKNPTRIDIAPYNCECVLIAGNGDFHVTYFEGQFNAYQRTYIIESLDKSVLNVRYLFYFFKSYINVLRNQSIGAVIKYLKLGMLTDAKIPLPPLEEQKRIASILDKADNLRRLYAQRRERTEELLRSTFLDMFGDPVTNPKGWEVKKLGDVVNFSTGNLNSNAAEENGIYPFFTCSRQPFRINSYAFDNKALLLAGNNASADYWVAYYHGKFNAYQRTYVITLKNSTDSYRYFQYALRFRLNELKRFSKGSNTKYLTLGILKPMPFQVPTAEAQKKFEDIIREYEVISSQIEKSIQISDDFFNSLLQRAFKGEL